MKLLKFQYYHILIYYDPLIIDILLSWDIWNIYLFIVLKCKMPYWDIKDLLCLWDGKVIQKKV